MKKNNFKNQKGVSIFLALLLIAIFLNLSLGLTFILFGEILMTRDVGHSIVAFYAADTGIERIFYVDNFQCFQSDCPDDCVEGCFKGLKSGYAISQVPLGESQAFYDASFVTTTAERIATSTGFFQKTRRSIQGRY